jgi:poly(A) polymerase
LRTSEEVYHRVRWDPTFDPARFTIGYEARRPEPKEIRLCDFSPGGDIPWHRVLYFKADGDIVWDRRTQIDLVLGDVVTEKGRRRDDEGGVLAGAFFTPRPSFTFDGTAWVVGGAAAGTTDGRVRVVTYNVLFDTFESERIATAQRIPALCHLLAGADADVIALQEVQPPLWRALLAEPWVRAAYAVSDGPDARTLDPSGVALLSRLPLRELGWHAYHDTKQTLAAVLDTGERPLLVATVHLTSNHAEDAERKRAAELEALLTAIGGGSLDAILLGDFNVGDEGTPPSLAAAGFSDAWRRLFPDDPGFTFDPTGNALARIMSRTGLPGRLDRVLSRGRLRAHAMRRLGTEPIGESLFVSDHYGLAAEIALEGAAAITTTLDAAPTHRTALAWLLPETESASVQALRADHDPSYARWMPHVNLVYGFVPEAHFAAAAQAIAAVARQHAPFDARFERMGWFEHASSHTGWIAPEPAAPWKRLQAELEALFPRCRAQKSADGFTPHLTVARLPRPQPLPLEPIATRVDRLALISRRGDEPFAVRHEIELASGSVVTPAKRGEPRALEQALEAHGAVEPPDRARRAAEVVARLASAGERVEIIGSRRFGAANASSDVDLVVIDRSPDPARAIAAVSGKHRLIEQAKIPVLQLETRDLSVDVAYVAAPSPADAVAEREALGNPLPLCAIADAEALLAEVDAPSFGALSRAIKTWARIRGLHDQGFGYLGGLGWSVLCARICREPAPLHTLIERFFETYGAWRWSEPIALTDIAAPVDRAAAAVVAPALPARNIARNTTRSTLAVLQEELFEGYEAFTAGAEDGYRRWLAPPDLHAGHARAVVLTVVANDGDALASARGWLRGHVLTLVRDLEDLGIEGLRPWPRAMGERYVIGLGREGAGDEPTLKACARLVAALDVRGARLEAGVVPFGELPSP